MECMAYPSHLASQITIQIYGASCFSFRKSERQQFGRRCNVDLPLGQVQSYQCRFPARWPTPWRPTPTPFKIQALTSSCFFGSASTHWKSWNRGVGSLTFLDCTGATVTYYIKAVNSVGESLVPRTTQDNQVAQLQSSPVCCSAWRFKSSILTRWNELIVDMFIDSHHQLINLIMTYLWHFYHEFNDQHDQPDSTGLHFWGTAASASVVVAWGQDGGSQSTSEGTTRSYLENVPRCSKGLNTCIWWTCKLELPSGGALFWSCSINIR